MQELIKITKQNDGSEVVSARDLYDFLGSKQEFSTWIKNRIEKYDFIENQDFTRFDKIVKTTGGRLIEYAITLDMAKELSMVEGNEKGKQARRYFIECENRLRQHGTPISLEDALIQQLQLSKAIRLEQEAQRIELDEVKSKVLAIEESKNQATDELLIADRSNEEVPEMTMRNNIRKIVNQYAKAKNVEHRNIWHVIYDRLYYRYSVNLNSCLKRKGESNLDVAERQGHLDKIYAIVSSEFKI